MSEYERAEREKFRRRKNCILKKADQLARISGADIFVFIARRDKHYLYKATEKPDFPPSVEQMVR